MGHTATDFFSFPYILFKKIGTGNLRFVTLCYVQSKILTIADFELCLCGWNWHKHAY
jgi:hypothetical protein